MIKFKDWLESLSQLSPKENPISDNGTNSDYNFGVTGAKYKYTSPISQETSKIKPKKLFGKRDIK
jgi:hypothetical protein